MAVNLSPYGGVGAQFLDNSGNVLTGGKIFTYAAGTTTPQATYTTSIGNIPHPNPIILDAAGRVPSGGEIWLTSGLIYKFILRDANDVLIGTYDNISLISTATQVSFTGFKSQTGVVQDLADNDGSDWIGFEPAGASAVARSAQDKMRDTVSVKDFGAVGDGVTNDSAAILAAFAYITSIGGGVVDFPNNNSIYLISYGFRIPSNCVVKLNGCTLKATTTFAQGTIPTEGAFAFFSFSRPTSESPLVSNTGNSSIIGDGAVFEMRRDEQTGTPPGYSGIILETTDAPAQVDNYKLKNIIVRDVTINHSGYDGVYVQGVQNALFDNVVVNYALRIGFTGISGDTVTFSNCQAIYTIGNNPNVPPAQRGPSNSGEGYWNEPNYDWQDINKWSYVNCKAIGNYQSGFKVWNAGADAQYHIQLDNCYAYANVFDETTGLLRSSPGEAGFIVNTHPTSSSQAMVTFNNCIAEYENGSGFVITPNGGGAGQTFIFNECTALNCNINNTNSANRAPFRVGTTAYLATPRVIFNNPNVIAPNANTLGYGIYIGSTTNISINNPNFFGNFTNEIPLVPLLGIVVLSGTASISTLTNETGTVTVTGAKVSDYVMASSSAVLNNGLMLTASVTAADTVTYYIRNVSAGTLTRAITNLFLQVIPNYGN
jgi:hypothetical protein